MKQLECKHCGWVHFSVSAKYVKQWAAEWVELFKTKDKEWLALYGITDAPPTIDLYLHCFRCGKTYKDMIPSTKDVNGHTVQPILDPKHRVPKIGGN